MLLRHHQGPGALVQAPAPPLQRMPLRISALPTRPTCRPKSELVSFATAASLSEPPTYWATTHIRWRHSVATSRRTAREASQHLSSSRLSSHSLPMFPQLPLEPWYESWPICSMTRTKPTALEKPGKTGVPSTKIILACPASEACRGQRRALADGQVLRPQTQISPSSVRTNETQRGS